MKRDELASLRKVLGAAEAVLGAREVDMLTTDDWDLLEHAVAEATQPPPDQRGETFAVEDDCLVRRVVPRRGKPYEHRCEKNSFETIAYAIDDLAGEAFILDGLRLHTGVPWTQIAVAVAFLKERGCVVPVHGRKHVAATKAVFEDAMTEFHALREVERTATQEQVDEAERAIDPDPGKEA